MYALGAVTLVTFLVNLGKISEVIGDFAKNNYKVMLMVGAFIALTIAIDDLITLFKGGKSVVGDWLDENFGPGTATQYVTILKEELRAVKGFFKDLFDLLTGKMHVMKEFGDYVGSLNKKITDLLGTTNSNQGGLFGGQFKQTTPVSKAVAKAVKMTTGTGPLLSQETPFMMVPPPTLEQKGQGLNLTARDRVEAATLNAAKVTKDSFEFGRNMNAEQAKIGNNYYLKQKGYDVQPLTPIVVNSETHLTINGDPSPETIQRMRDHAKDVNDKPLETTRRALRVSGSK
jgi:hypothetical protein